MPGRSISGKKQIW